MVLSTKEKMEKRMKEMRELPEAKLIMVTPDGNLHLAGSTPESSSTYHNFVVIRNSCLFAGFNGQKMGELLDDANIVLGIKSESKCLLFNDDGASAIYVSNKNNPDKGDHFLMTAFSEKIIEVVFFNGALYPAFCRILFSSQKLAETMVLTLALAASIDPDISSKLQKFIAEAGGEYNG